MNIFILLLFTFNTVFCTVLSSELSFQHHIPSELTHSRKVTVNQKRNQFNRSIFSRYDFCSTQPCQSHADCNRPGAPPECPACVTVPGSPLFVRICDY
ncbi:hypothetical protein I7I50_12622 [Histoplasma capsulatum G186AR]|uniref:Secreted protein n=1 Tax=Ajellomyces capsulatus TaxID=5037 RepID=A0A8H7YCW2_AJECA|nr:hypothetical protein I7I52_11073 [Histoplasma capsulatum]QSS70852.1 hypothetical protein I7I50_12622 [Histoplasma capsulatum G186AR]